MNNPTNPTHTTLFVKTGCSRCAKTREYLAAQHVDFLERNVTNEPQALEEMKRLSGQDQTPVLIFEGDVLNGCDDEQLASFLAKHDAHAQRVKA